MQIPINVYFLKQRVLRASKRDLEQEISTTLDQDWIFFLQNFRSTKQANVEWPSFSCERFEPRSHFKSRLSLIVQVNVVLNRTVVVDSD